jgi:hypothetical protein
MSKIHNPQSAKILKELSQLLKSYDICKIIDHYSYDHHMVIYESYIDLLYLSYVNCHFRQDRIKSKHEKQFGDLHKFLFSYFLGNDTLFHNWLIRNTINEKECCCSDIKKYKVEVTKPFSYHSNYEIRIICQGCNNRNYIFENGDKKWV